MHCVQNLLLTLNMTVADRSVEGHAVNVCQDPMEIYSRLLMNHTVQGELVMDCFAGSGTCTVAALISGRNVIAIEPDQRQVEGIQIRIDEVQTLLQTTDNESRFITVTPITLDEGQRAGPVVDKIQRSADKAVRTASRQAAAKERETKKANQAANKKRKMMTKMKIKERRKPRSSWREMKKQPRKKQKMTRNALKKRHIRRNQLPGSKR